MTKQYTIEYYASKYGTREVEVIAISKDDAERKFHEACGDLFFPIINIYVDWEVGGDDEEETGNIE